eukprot:4716550-Alexandrium_andersonii.AAC.1
MPPSSSRTTSARASRPNRDPGPGRDPSAGGPSVSLGGGALPAGDRRGSPSRRKAVEQPSLGWAACEPWRATRGPRLQVVPQGHGPPRGPVAHAPG